MGATDSLEAVLILAPMGRDASVASAILQEISIGSRTVTDLETLVGGLDEACAAIIAEEALVRADPRRLVGWIESQPPWSDFPFILLSRRENPANARIAEMLGNVTLLERPFHPGTLVSAVRSAVRARRRQREAEAFLEERRQTAERQALLIRELHHRVKNTLATVQALVGATSRSARTVEEFYHAFSARIVSLAKTHTLLTEDYWQTASLREMLMNELGPYDDDTGRRIILNGPPVELASDLAVPTGMAIHELTTNAAKHGALSVPTGCVEVIWDVKQNGDGRKLSLEWTERGGPPVDPPERKGFGSTLLQRVLTSQCQADICMEFEPDGLRFRMEAPLLERRLVPPY
jgi:two-component sensor histidine kinase